MESVRHGYKPISSFIQKRKQILEFSEKSYFGKIEIVKKLLGSYSWIFLLKIAILTPLIWDQKQLKAIITFWAIRTWMGNNKNETHCIKCYIVHSVEIIFRNYSVVSFLQDRISSHKWLYLWKNIKSFIRFV